MSFLKTLATLAVGFAAAKGYDKFQKSGGLAGMKEAMKKPGEPGGMADQIAAMAEKMGVPGGAQGVKDMLARAGGAAEGAVKAGEAGLGSLIAMMQGSARAGAEMFEKTLGQMPGGSGAAAMTEANAKLMIRAMIMAAKADGTVDSEEKARIMALLGDASEDELAYVQAQLDAPIDITALAAETSEAMRVQIFGAAAMAMRSDTPAEAAFLDQLAAALGIDAEARKAAEAAMGRA
jgi:uncharacterized membrane protein YebE (DUF533 family)